MNTTTLYSKFLQFDSKKQEHYSTFNFDTLAITSTQALLLQHIVYTLNPKHLLEFGTSCGYSLFSMIAKLSLQDDFSQKTFTSIEIDTKRYIEAKKLFNALFDSCKNEIMPSQLKLYNTDIFDTTLLPMLLSVKYDIIFCDCMQSEYLSVFEYILKHDLLSSKGVMIFENCISHSYEFYEMVSKKYAHTFKSTLYSLHNGLLVIEYLNK